VQHPVFVRCFFVRMRPPADVALLTFKVAVALGFLATASVIARFIARRKTKTKFLADDYVTLAAWVFMMGLIVNIGICTSSDPPDSVCEASDWSQWFSTPVSATMNFFSVQRRMTYLER